MNYVAQRCEKVSNKRRNSALKRMRVVRDGIVKIASMILFTGSNDHRQYVAQKAHTPRQMVVLPNGVYEHAFLCMLSVKCSDETLNSFQLNRDIS